VLVYTFVERSHAAKGHEVTTESWACAARELDNVGSVCLELRAARYLLVPEVVLGAIMLSLVVWMRLGVTKERRAVEQVALGDGNA
jgi:hypothetical protein